jgi:hypothetical protein
MVYTTTFDREGDGDDAAVAATTRGFTARLLLAVLSQALLVWVCVRLTAPPPTAVLLRTRPPPGLLSHHSMRHIPAAHSRQKRPGSPGAHADARVTLKAAGDAGEEAGDFFPDFFERARMLVVGGSPAAPEPPETAIAKEAAEIPSGPEVGPMSDAEEFRLNSFAGFVATMLSAAVTFPIDTLKTRLQAGRKPLPDERSVRGLYRGMLPSMIVFCPTVSVFVGLTYWLKAQLLTIAPFAGGGSVVAGLVAGALSNLFLSFYRVPTGMMVKLIQTGVCPTARSALQRIFFTEGCWRRLFTIWVVVLFKDIPNGALRIGIYQLYQQCLGLLQGFGMAAVTQRTLSGILAGMTLGVVANPIDLVVTRAMVNVDNGGPSHDPGVPTKPHLPLQNPIQTVQRICGEIYAQNGLRGFFAGAMVRALARIPSTCIWFATFDLTKAVLLRRWY